MISLRPTWRACCFTCGMLIVLPCIASLASTRYSNKSLCNQSHLWKRILVQPSSIIGPRYAGGSSNWFTAAGRGSTRYTPAARRYGNIATSSFLGRKVEVVSDVLDDDSDGKNESHHLLHLVRSTISRRKTLTHVAAAAAAMLVSDPFASIDNLAMADVGTLPELKGAPAILQGITVSVADESQQNSMIRFLVEGFLFKVLRQRTVGTVTDTVRTDQQLDC
jgi:hypothetical protein